MSGTTLSACLDVLSYSIGSIEKVQVESEFDSSSHHSSADELIGGTYYVSMNMKVLSTL